MVSVAVGFHVIHLATVTVFSSTEEADRAALEEHERLRKQCCGILHPETSVSIFYNQMHMCGIMYMLVMLPVRTSFDIVLNPSNTMFWVDVGIDCFIVADICLNFRRFYQSKGELVTDPKLIRANYLQGWFFVDTISVIPFNYLYTLVSATDPNNMASGTHLLRLTRIARFFRLVRYFQPLWWVLESSI